MDDLMAGPTRCLLVQPGFSGNSFFNFSNVARLVGARYTAAPLGLMTVAALLPQHWQFKLVDENVEPLTDAHLDWAQIVMTGGMLPQQQNIFTIAQRARVMGKPVVVGGPDPTQQPHLYTDADCLVLGEGEVTIPHFIDDLSRGAASGVYRSDERADMAQSVVPRFDLIRFADYMRVGIQFSRGCPYNCEFCDIIELFGRRPRTKPAEHILAELQALYDLGYRGHVDFVDDNFIGNKAHVVDVLEAIRDWSAQHDYPFYFSTEASINLAKEEKLLRLMYENDFRYVFVGIESPDEDVLAGTQKKQNHRVSVPDAVRTLSEHGMIVNGGFILGFDGETEHTARRMIDLIQEAGIATAMVGMLTALPNTQLSRRLEREGRLFSAEGLRITDTAQDIDNTTTGLNFASQRPRVDILRDHSEVLRAVYAPRYYFDRVRTTALALRSNRRYRPAFGESLRRVWAFVQVCLSVGLNPRTGPAYWRTLFAVLIRKPASAGAAVSMSALYMHFGKQADYVTGMLEERVAQVLRYGEERYNRIRAGAGVPAG